MGVFSENEKGWYIAFALRENEMVILRKLK